MSKSDTNTRTSFKFIILRGILYAVVIPVVIVLAIAGVFYVKNQIEASVAQSEMKSYLEDKYGQEFVVERPKREGSGLGVEGTLAARAYPTDDSDLRFLVQSSSAGTEDYYLSSVWSRSENEKFVNNKEIDRAWISPEITVGASYELRKAYKGAPKVYGQMLATDAKKLIYAVDAIRNSDVLAVEDKDRVQLAILIDHINRQRVGARYIHYKIYHKDTDSSIVCNITVEDANETIDKQQVYECFRKNGVSDERY